MKPTYLITQAALALLLWPAAAVSAQTSAANVVLAGPVSGVGSALQETALGDVVADAVRNAGSADVAIVPADEIADAVLPSGRLTSEQLQRALPYGSDAGDTVVVLKLSGTQLLQAIERSVSRVPQPFDGFLQVSGLQIQYDPTQPEGRRVRLAGEGGSEIDVHRTYRVATTHPLAHGSLGYFEVWNQGDIAADTGIPVTKSLMTYLQSHPGGTGVQGRIATH